MEIIDLKIGNLVDTRAGTIKIFQLDSFQNEINYDNADDYNPIKLDDVFAERFGFELIDGWQVPDGEVEKYTLSDFKLYIHSDGSTVLNYRDIEFENIYVHQLQNIYSIFTNGNQLTYKVK